MDPGERGIGDGTDLQFTVGEDPRPLIPEGRYDVMYVKHEKRKFFGGSKLYLTFEIVTPGEYLGVRLFKPYNFYEPLPRGSDLFKDLILIYGNRVSKKTKLPISLFRAKVLTVHVRTVKTNRKQESHSLEQMYSVVDRIITVAAGEGRL